MHCTRRTLLGGLVALGAGLEPRAAGASLARGLTLEELVSRSAHGLVATALEAHCEWATFGKSRVIVTETRLRVDEPLLDREVPRELLVRVLGGHIGDLGERVDGQPELVLGQPCALFVLPARDAATFVTGAAQGHFPLYSSGGERRLAASPELPRLLKREGSASLRLPGTTISEARALLRSLP